MNLPSQLLSLIGYASLNGGLLILLLLLLRPWLRRVSGSQWTYRCWVIVLLKLFLLPIGMSWSIAELWPAVSPAKAETSVWKIRSHLLEGPERSDFNSGQSTVAVMPPLMNRTALLLAGWAIGVVGMGFYVALGSWRTRLLCRRAQPIDSRQLQRLLRDFPSDLRGGVRIYVTDEIPVAALAGLWRPRILLPRDWLARLDEEELRHVILHELGHARRGDLLGQWLMAIACCLHWFNPLVWLAARSLRMDAELACDAWVLARVTENERAIYGATLLKTSQFFRVPLRMLTAAIGMAASRESLIARVHQVGRYQTTSRFREILGMAIAAGAVAILGMTRIAAQDPVPSPSAQEPPPRLSVAPAPSTPAPMAVTGKPESTTTAASGQDALKSTDKEKEKGKPGKISMIEIESKFFEVPESVGRKLGLISTPSGSASTLGGKSDPSAKSSNASIFSLNAVMDKPAMLKLLKALNEAKGVDLVSAPRVTTKSGQRAVLEMIREFRYPSEFKLEKEILVPTVFETRNLGVTLEVEPILTEDGVIDLNLIPQVVELEGYTRSRDSLPVMLANGRSVGANMTIQAFKGINYPKDATLQPVFSTRKITTSVSIYPGSTILIGGLKREDQAEGKAPTTRILYVLVTANLVDSYLGTPPPTPANSGAGSTPQNPSPGPLPVDAPKPPTEPDDAMLDAIPSGKAGYVVSPYAPKAGYIDVRGFPSGTELKCPYTGRMMKLP